jgi:hypothetical protein
MRGSKIELFLQQAAPLVAKVAYFESQKLGVAAAELESYGRSLVLTKLLSLHNPERGALSTFLVRALRNAFRDYAEHERKMIPFSSLVRENEEGEETSFLEKMLPTTDFVYPEDEDVTGFLREVRPEARAAVRSVLQAQGDMTGKNSVKRQAKEALWDWFQGELRKAAKI